ncbi:MAG: peptidoglycan DD-metalloendopeptidase family protein [Gammaproteobacteria bacterium]
MHRKPCRVLVLAAIVLLGGCAGALNLPASHRAKSYTVHRGDTLYSIAWHYGLDYHAVARWNGISYPYTIHPGERVYLYPRQINEQRNTADQEISRPTKSRETAPVEVAKTPPPKYESGKSSGRRMPSSGTTMVYWQWPANGTVHATFGQNGIAGKGIVIEGTLGEPVEAAAGGTVVYAGDALVGYGRLIIVKHNDEWLSAYGHNQRLLVHEGETVQAGGKIATMGLAPDGKSELYFEIRRDGKPVDPLHFLSAKR